MPTTAVKATPASLPGWAPGPVVPALPLTPFEQYMLLDDRPAYPMNFFVRLRFTGRLDPDLFPRACSQAAGQHPLLCARIGQRRRERWQWATDSPVLPAVEWHAVAPADSLPPATPIDLRREPGVQIHVRQGEATSDVTFQFHHAACDGLGAFQVIGEVLLAYAFAVGSTTHRTQRPALAPGLLRRRGAFGLTFRRLLRLLPRQVIGLLGARQFLMRRPVPLCGTQGERHGLPERCDAPSENWPASFMHCFDDAETVGLRTAARQQGVTINDLLTRDLFLTLAAWRRSNGQGFENDWLRISVPMNLRGPHDRRLPAANVVSMVFLDRRCCESGDPDVLLNSIRQEMGLISRNHLGLTFVLSLALAARLPGGLKRLMPGDKCSATAVLTNVGEVFGRLRLPRDSQRRIVLGGTTLEAIDGLAPLRPHTTLAITAFRYAGRQCTTFHYDPRCFTQPEAHTLRSDYLARIRKSASADRSIPPDSLPDAPPQRGPA